MTRPNRSLQSCGTDDVKILAYIAGFFDAEGCVRIQKRRYDKANHTLRCCISQIDKIPLDFISLYFGGGIHAKKGEIGGQKMWRWSCSTRFASNFLKSIEPYLIVKKAEALLAAEFQKSMIGRWGGRVVDRVTERELAVREAQRILMQSLKNRKSTGIPPNNIGRAKRNSSNLMINIDESTLAYIAGFFDGDGTITLCQRNKKYASNYRLSCGINQIDKLPLEFVASYFGGNVRTKKAKVATNMWAWSNSGKYSLAFLKAILPYLITKKAQAIVAISFQARMNSKGNRRVDSHELAVREAERILVHNLKSELSTELPIIKVPDNIQGVLF